MHKLLLIFLIATSSNLWAQDPQEMTKKIAGKSGHDYVYNNIVCVDRAIEAYANGSDFVNSRLTGLAANKEPVWTIALRGRTIVIPEKMSLAGHKILLKRIEQMDCPEKPSISYSWKLSHSDLLEGMVTKQCRMHIGASFEVMEYPNTNSKSDWTIKENRFNVRTLDESVDASLCEAYALPLKMEYGLYDYVSYDVTLEHSENTCRVTINNNDFAPEESWLLDLRHCQGKVIEAEPSAESKAVYDRARDKHFYAVKFEFAPRQKETHSIRKK